MRTLVLGLCVAFLSPLPVPASTEDTESYFPQQLSANDLLTLCASSSLTAKGRARRSYCDGFISGIEEGLRLYKISYPIDAAATVCVPEGTRSRTMAESFIRHASAKGVDLSQPAASVALAALRAAFPC